MTVTSFRSIYLPLQVEVVEVADLFDDLFGPLEIDCAALLMSG